MTKQLELIQQIQDCRICEPFLEHGVRPVVQMSPVSKILIAGQAPGIKVHNSGIPFDDPSGDRLREWLGLDRKDFYDAKKVAILPMGFCYPGKGKSGDLPPRRECAAHWRQQALSSLPDIRLTLAIGKYAIDYHFEEELREQGRANLTETVKNWKTYLPTKLPLPHPSPRNNIWLKKNPWFESEVVPKLKSVVKKILGQGS